jgi:hypothetical protein
MDRQHSQSAWSAVSKAGNRCRNRVQLAVTVHWQPSKSCPQTKRAYFRHSILPSQGHSAVLWRSGGDLLRVQCVQSFALEGSRRERGGQPWRPPLCRGTVWRRPWLCCQGRSWCSGAAGPGCGRRGGDWPPRWPRRRALPSSAQTVPWLPAATIGWRFAV